MCFTLAEISKSNITDLKNSSSLLLNREYASRSSYQFKTAIFELRFASQSEKIASRMVLIDLQCLESDSACSCMNLFWLDWVAAGYR